MKIFPLCTIFFLLLVAVVSRSNANDEWSKATNYFEREEFVFAFDGNECRLFINGMGLCINSEGKTVEFNLALAEADRVVNIQVFNYLDSLCLIYEFHDYESGGTTAVLLDSKSFNKVWALKIPGLNVGEGLLRGNFLYVTAMGFIGKIDLKSGEYIWQHDKLYRPPDLFNKFKRPVSRTDDYVYFTEEEPTYYKKRKPMTLKVYNLTGDILWDDDMYDTGQCKLCEDCCDKNAN